MFTKELIKLSNGVPESHSIWHPLLDLVSTDRLNRYLTLKRIRDCSELVLETTRSATDRKDSKEIETLYWYVACYITYLRREITYPKCQKHMGTDSGTKRCQTSLMITQSSNKKSHSTSKCTDTNENMLHNMDVPSSNYIINDIKFKKI